MTTTNNAFPKRLCVVEKVLLLLSSNERIEDGDDTLTLLCNWCKDDKSEVNALITHPDFIAAITQRFKQFNEMVLYLKQSTNKPSNHVFSNFFAIMHAVNDLEQVDAGIVDKVCELEVRMEDCLFVLTNLCAASGVSQLFTRSAKIRSVLWGAQENPNTNLVVQLTKLFSHCEIYRLTLSNLLFRFLQSMLPPANTTKAHNFCRDLDIAILVDRCCSFLIYRMHIDGDGRISDDHKQNYNSLYGIQSPLQENIDGAISIASYFISSKAHQQLVLNHPQLTSCIATLCIRLCHEVQRKYHLDLWRPRIMQLRVGLISDKEYHSKYGPQWTQLLSAMGQDIMANGWLYFVSFAITMCMEYLYHYSIKSDIAVLKIPLGEHGQFEPFDDSWLEYQYICALLNWVTRNKQLELYLDTIASKLGYGVQVDKQLEKKKKHLEMSRELFANNKLSCFYSKCNNTASSENGAKLRKCGQCHHAYYCSKQCQKLDWKYHRNICKAPTAETDEKETKDICDNTGCHTTGKLRRCTGCLEVAYCSVECQTQHWKQHKDECKTKQNEK